jgi:hypothetical protein
MTSDGELTKIVVVGPDGTDPDLTPFAWACPHVHSDSATYYEVVITFTVAPFWVTATHPLSSSSGMMTRRISNGPIISRYGATLHAVHIHRLMTRLDYVHYRRPKRALEVQRRYRLQTR